MGGGRSGQNKSSPQHGGEQRGSQRGNAQRSKERGMMLPCSAMQTIGPSMHLCVCNAKISIVRHCLEVHDRDGLGSSQARVVHQEDLLKASNSQKPSPRKFLGEAVFGYGRRLADGHGPVVHITHILRVDVWVVAQS